MPPWEAAWTPCGSSREPPTVGQAGAVLTLHYPDGVDVKVLGKVRANGAVLAGGLHPAIRERYFRVGHMGAVTASDILATAGAIERALAETGYRFDVGAGVAAAQRALVG